MMKRIDSSPEKVERAKRRMEECFCRGRTPGGKERHGIVHKVFAARYYDGIRCLVAWEPLRGGGPVFLYHDMLEVDV